MSRILKGCERAASGEPQRLADHLMLQMVAKLQETAGQGDECSQGTSLISGNTCECPHGIEVQSRNKKLRTMLSMSSQETSEATAMSSHGFEASLQKAQSSTPPPEFEYDHSKAVSSPTHMPLHQQGIDNSAQEMLESMKQAAARLQKARGDYSFPVAAYLLICLQIYIRIPSEALVVTISRP